MIEYAPSSSSFITYDEALLYCTFCKYNGHTDWRMPTFDEWIEHRVGVNPKVKLYRWYVGRDQGVTTFNNSLLPHKWYVVPVRDV